MFDGAHSVRRTFVRVAGVLTRASSVVLPALLAIGLAVGPVIGVMGWLNGVQVQVAGGTIRVVGQLALAGVLAHIAIERGR